MENKIKIKVMMMRAKCYFTIKHGGNLNDATMLAIYVNEESMNVLKECIGKDSSLWSEKQKEQYDFLTGVRDNLIKEL